MKKVSLARLALTLFAITAAVAAALAGVNALTRDKIAAIEAQKTRDAVTQVLEGEAARLTDVECYGMVEAVYEGPGGYAVQVNTAGFGGALVMMVGVSHEGVVTGVSVISHTETAGLGSVAGEDSAKGAAFRNQFNDQPGPFLVDKDGGQVDSITGATITSRAVTQGVNAALEFVENLD